MTNIQIYQSFFHQPIKFGSLVQLQHVASGKFLSIYPSENANIEKDNIKIGLSDFFSDKSLIRILSGFKYQKEGNSLVRYNDRIIFELILPGVSRLGYLHTSEKTLSFAKEVNCSIEFKTK